jgi:hypothetical protein
MNKAVLVGLLIAAVVAVGVIHHLKMK